nr:MULTISPECIES: DUF5605 domain-containing protein [Clostridia]
MFELKFHGEEPVGSQVDVDVSAEFTCGSITKKVKGFYAGNGIYKVRFLPQQAGTYDWKVTGVVSGEGQEVCTTENAGHGLVRAVDTHFEFEDGTRYIPFGTTIYALINQSEELIETTLDSLEKAPFNKLRHCVFPKHYDYNHNEPQYYAFEKDENGKWDVNRPCFAFWDHFEKILARLSELKIQSDLILFHPYDRWGFSELSREENHVYLDYLIRRLASYPDLWWSMSNEYDLVFSKTMDDWYDIEEYVANEDPYGHLLSNHNCFGFYDFTRENITHCSIQISLLYKAAVWIEQYCKPVIYDECCYEGNLELAWGNISAQEMTSRFWKAYAVGAYATHGETYLSNDEILWWARGGRLKGHSPERIAFLREVMESIPGTLRPWHAMPYLGENAADDIAKYGSLMESPFFNLMKSLPQEVKDQDAEKMTQYTGQSERAFIRYFNAECCAQYHMSLPEDKDYKVEIIDTWEMTRVTFAEHASGQIVVELPGKERMAVLAIEN